MKRFDEVNKDRLSIANGSIDTICEERKISMLEIYNKEIINQSQLTRVDASGVGKFGTRTYPSTRVT